MRRWVGLLLFWSFLVSLMPAPAAQAQTARRILSRSDWGADDSLLVQTDEPTARPVDAPVDNGDAPPAALSVREKDCLDAQTNHPTEFQRSTPVTRNARGEKLRWPQEFSPSVRLLVLHHTALRVTGDARPGIERMRALYEYHAKNRGWGDIGYHYVIDEAGQIYEGKSGGDSVVGGHVYCNNVGTIGVALMGNFELETPTQAQVRSAQWLMKLLAEKYSIDLKRNVLFHGKELPPIVTHRDLISTDCPGYVLYGAMDQIRANIKSGNVDGAVTFPRFQDASSSSATDDLPPGAIPTDKDGLASLTETTIEGRPGGEIIIPIYFRAQRKNYTGNTRIARITRTRELQLWQEKDGKYVPIRGDIRVPVPLVKKGDSIVLRVKVKLPMTRGVVTMQIGSLKYTFELSGRSVRGTQLLSPTGSSRQLLENPSPRTSSVTSPSNSSSSVSSVPSVSSDSSQRIRILISKLTCQASTGIPEDISRRFRGSLECTVVNGTPRVINTLPLEEYLMGLSEEPDTEPYEKQRAFAIAARTYALFYMDPQHRKFPGAPYDGSDDPATFQAYGGKDFENRNPQWLRAVRETAGQVMRYEGEVIKPPYFSQSDGRTRSPAEAGWKDFPFAQIFSSKPDPWCSGMTLRGHGVGMSGCGAEAQAHEGKTAEQILQYYYPGTTIAKP